MRLDTEGSIIVDVLIPAYNVGSTLEASLASIQNQTLRNIRIIVVNDGSTDQTGAILDKVAAKDDRIVPYHQANCGIVAALNNGLRQCSATYIARHDADDVAFSNRLQSQLNYLLSNDDCLAVGANAFHIDETGSRLQTMTGFVEEVTGDPRRAPAKEPYLLHPFLMVRRQELSQVGGYRSVIHAEDTDLYWRLSERGRLHNITDYLGEYRVHQNSISAGSALNGRISAVNSQLAALSFLRRQANIADIDFSSELLVAYKAGSSLERIIDIASRQLVAEERRHLRLSAVAKYLQLLSYRPYMPDLEDCVFIRRVYREQKATISRQNSLFIEGLLAKVTRKLLQEMRIDQIYALGTIASLPKTLLGVATRRWAASSTKSRSGVTA